jgi:hypothetical protein
MATVAEEPRNFKQENARWKSSGANRTASDTLAAALYYNDHGCFVVPCCTMTTEGKCTFPHPHATEKSMGKVPILGEGWQHARLTREEIIQRWTEYPTANVGVLLEPSGLLVADLDSQEAEEEASRKGLPPGPQVRTGRGVQHYFRNPKGIVGLAIKRGESSAIDLLSRGIAVGFGSIHRTGKRYEQLVSWEEWELEEPPLWAEQLLLDSLKNHSVAADIADDLPPVDLEALQLPRWLSSLIMHGQPPRPADPYPSRSEAVWAVVTALVEAGHDNNTIASTLLDPRYKISAKPREQGPRWLAGEIGRARAKTHTKTGNGQDPGTSNGSVPPEPDWSDEDTNAHYTKGERPVEDDPPEPDWSDHTEGKRPETQPQRPFPEIQINNRPLRKVTADALAAVAQQNDPPITFVRDAGLVRVQRNERGQAGIAPLNEHGVRGLLTRSAEYLKKTYSEKNGWTATHVAPPLDVVRDLMALGTWPEFSPLEAVTETPILRYDGSLVDNIGYDASTRLYYDPAPGLVVPPVPAHPIPADIADARAFLEIELLGDFPFCGDADRANTTGMFVTPIIRQTFCDVAPLGIIDKPQGGTGASLVADILGVTHVGDQRGMMGAPVDEEEWRKQISTVLSTGTTLIVVDNVEHALGAPALERALTSATWKDRALGSNKEIRLPQRATWVATGNNIRLRRSMQRRCYWIRMDAKMARPWQRKQFKHPELVTWAQANRGKILHALLTLVRAWVVAGKPEAKVPTIGGFDSWTHTVGGILAYAGIKGFLGNLEEMYQMADEESEEWEAFLRRWHEIFADAAQPVSVVVKYLKDEVGVAGTLSDVLPDDLSSIPERNGDGKPISLEKRLGKALSKKLGVRYGDDGIHLEKTGEGKKAKLWCVKLSDLASNQGV